MQTEDDVVPLLDNPEFLDELGSLEDFPQEQPGDFPAPVVKIKRRTIAVPVAAARPAAEPRGKGPQFMMPALKPTAIVAPAPRPSPMRTALAVVGFALMMSVGAAAAALVFHDRVTQIVLQWQNTGR